MMNVLLESRPKSARRIGGTVASTLVHGALLAAAVILTLPPRDGGATAAPPKPPVIIYIENHDKTPTVQRHDSRPRPSTTTSETPPAPGPILKFNGPDVPAIHDPVSISSTTPDEFGSGIQTNGPIGAPTGIGAPGGVVDEHLVDRSPRLVGTPAQPEFPFALRQSGRGGRVLVQFVVDTTGRAEMNGFKVMESTDPLFGESVRNVLPRYRFSPGEAGGRKVRTLVQLPFDFTLVR